MREDLYEIPITSKLEANANSTLVRNGLYLPTANITFGHSVYGVDFVFKNMLIAAECGMKTSYEVEFRDEHGTEQDMT